MRSSISSSDLAHIEDHPVVERDVPDQPWAHLLAIVLVLLAIAVGGWEWRMRSIGLEAGDGSDDASAWAAERRRIDTASIPVAIVGDSRLLFGVDLGHFRSLTGAEPLQLSIRGTNPLFLLRNIAEDEDFRGIAVVAFNEFSVFGNRIGGGGGAEALERYRYESPASRAGHLLHGSLSQALAFLDEGYRLSVLVRRLDRAGRNGARSPYNSPWKLSTMGPARDTRMWSRIERPGFLQDHARHVWMAPARQPLPPESQRATVIAQVRADIARIRARGGDVVFFRAPTSDPFWAVTDAYLPRADGWDRLLAETGTQGLHFLDDPVLRELDTPEYSHVSRACATVMTDVLARWLAEGHAALSIRAATSAMTASDCQPRNAG